MEEYFFQCLPMSRDWEEISMLLDPSIQHQKYIEDCEICCNPMELTVTFEEGHLTHFEAASIEQ